MSLCFSTHSRHFLFASTPVVTLAAAFYLDPIFSMDQGSSSRKKRKRCEESTDEPAPFHHWSSSSSESEYGDFYYPTILAAGNLNVEVTKKEIKAFFKSVAEPEEVSFSFAKDKNGIQKRALIKFRSTEDAKAALRKKGDSLLGKPIYLTPCSNGRVTFWIGGFEPQLPEDVIKDEISEIFQPCGEIYDIFLPKIKGRCLGFAYIYLNQQNMNAVEASKASEVVAGENPKIQGREIEFCNVNLKKWVNQAICENYVLAQDILNEKLELLDLTSIQPVIQSSSLLWRNDRPHIFPPPYNQEEDDCWAVALFRGYSVVMNLLNRSSENLLTIQMIKDGVDFRHQLSGKGIDKLINAVSFMKNYVKEMKIHNRPKNASEDEYEEFEKNIIRVLKKGPVMVTIDWLPSYDDFDGEGIYCPTESDFYRRQMEKLQFHCLLLSGHDIERCGEEDIEFFEFQDSNGDKWGKEGFIKMARHKRIIKQVIELKV